MALSELLDQSGRLRGRKFAILLLISAEEPANGQQNERRNGEVIDRKRDCPCALRKKLLDGSRVQQNVDQQPVWARDKRSKDRGADRHQCNAQRQLRCKLRDDGQGGQDRTAAALRQRVLMEAAIGAEHLTAEGEIPDAADDGQHTQRKQTVNTNFLTA